MFESNLLSQINIKSPLPTFIETEIINSINSSLRKTFQFCHLLLSERFDFIAEKTFYYNDEIYLIFNIFMERLLLWNAQTTFTELMFGLQRCSLYPTKHNNKININENKNININQLFSYSSFQDVLCGPRPAITAEEAAMAFVNKNNNNNDVLHYNNDNEHITAESSTELYATSTGSPYAYLKFNNQNSKQLKYISLFLVTLKPYIELKLKNKYQEITSESEDDVALRRAIEARLFPNNNENNHHRQVTWAMCFSPPHIRYFLLYKVFPFLFPMYHVLNESLSLLYKILYLCELTPFLSVYHRFFNIIVRRSTQSDYTNFSKSPRTRRALLIARVLLVSIFFGFRLLEMTRPSTGNENNNNNNDNEASSQTKNFLDNDFPIPPPPQFGVDVTIKENNENEKEENHNHVEDKTLPEPGFCAVGSHRITNAAVLTTSGVMGCYPCLLSYIEKKESVR
ncbi:peroxin-12 [Angomonas deanei]|uniref:Pex2 / Pex12 amino terminal region containing protein, putative n=1 Tax=Angomonas deanei TaxID=59799 RepID=A0A7G2CDZ1_9TRYP|nr:peroxin-12 [Angomonas deanei]CAD2217605.1 Pex2 / Pex12 amino terminal region containing protein, putative [Angomonas deanei]|eukprot:EPY24575.1 peroxin-12 [Angomonas deanei]